MGRHQERYAQAGMAGLAGEVVWRRGRRRGSGKRLRSIEISRSQGLSNRAIAQRLGVNEKAIGKLVGPSKRAELEQLSFVDSPSNVPRSESLQEQAPSTEPEKSAAEKSADPPRMPSASDAANEAAVIDEHAQYSEPVPMSLDRDATDRRFDRQLAHLGLVDGAAPLFRDGSQVPGAGVLLALPCLIESALLRISRKLYGEIGPAFYGLRTTLLTLMLMALLRVQRPEQLKERDPATLGLRQALGAGSGPGGQDPQAWTDPPRRTPARRAVGSRTGAPARRSARASDGLLVCGRPRTRLSRGTHHFPGIRGAPASGHARHH